MFADETRAREDYDAICRMVDEAVARAIASRAPMLDAGRRKLRIPDERWIETRRAVAAFAAWHRAGGSPPERLIIDLKGVLAGTATPALVDVAQLRASIVTMAIQEYYRTNPTNAC